MIIGRFVISNTGSTPDYEGGIRVYLNSELLGTVRPSSRNPLSYCRKHPKSKYTSHLRNILNQAGATQDELEQVFRFPLNNLS